METTPDFAEALDVDHARDGEVMLAYSMNGEPLPTLNGFPLRLIVPGYYGTYWVKHLNEITVVDSVFDGFWMETAYRIPDTDCNCVELGTAPKATIPVNRFTVRSFITNVEDGATVRAGKETPLNGIAFDGGTLRGLKMPREVSLFQSANLIVPTLKILATKYGRRQARALRSADTSLMDSNRTSPASKVKSQNSTPSTGSCVASSLVSVAIRSIPDVTRTGAPRMRHRTANNYWPDRGQWIFTCCRRIPGPFGDTQSRCRLRNGPE
jgi:hypothetical protein